MTFEDLLQDVEENLTRGVLDIDANKFGPDADTYIERIKNKIISRGYDILCVLKDTEQAVYQIHIKKTEENTNA